MYSKKEFIEAVQQGDNEKVRGILEEMPHLAKAKNDKGVSVVVLAAYYRNAEMIEALLQHRTEIDIFEAAATGYPKSTGERLKENPDLLNAFSPDGFTPLGLACFFGNKNVVKLLLEKNANVNVASNNNFKVAPLHSAVASKHLEIAKMLLEKNAQVNLQQQSGVTPLHSAAHNGDLDMVKLLLENKAKIDVKMQDGKMPIDFAREEGFEEIVALLGG